MRTRSAVGPLVMVGATAVVLAAALAGPATIGPQPTAGRLPERSEPPLITPPPPGAPAAPGPLGDVIGGIALAVLVAVAVLIVAVLVLLLRRVLHGRRAAGPAEAAEVGLGDLVDSAEAADAPVVRRGIAAALLALDEEREPGDAVVRAWLGLQQSAEDAGVARGRAETPTDFAVRVLGRTGADERATRTLLVLYLRARFGGTAVTAEDAAAARRSLELLLASWAAIGAGEPAR